MSKLKTRLDDRRGKIPVTTLKNMGIVEFSRYFRPMTVERAYLDVLNVLALLRAVPPLSECASVPPRRLALRLGKAIDSNYRAGSPAPLAPDERRPEFRIGPLYGERGDLLAMSLESGEIGAVLSPGTPESGGFDLVRLKDGPGDKA